MDDSIGPDLFEEESISRENVVNVAIVLGVLLAWIAIEFRDLGRAAVVSHLLIRWWVMWNDVEVRNDGSSSGLNRL